MMNIYRLAQNILPKINKTEEKGFTTLDLIAHLFVIGLVVATIPIFFSSSTTSSDFLQRNRATLLMRASF